MTILISKYWEQFVVTKCSTISKTLGCEFCVGRNSLIFDCDKIKIAENITDPINDCIAIERDDQLYVGIVDLKGKRYPPDHTMAQLRTGETIARRIINDSNIKEKHKMYKIIVAKSHPFSSARLSHIKRKSLKSGLPLITAHCDDTFYNARKKKRFG